MFWINAKKNGVWKLHKESCQFCHPIETKWQGLNQMKQYGGWFQFNSTQDAYKYYKSKQ